MNFISKLTSNPRSLMVVSGCVVGLYATSLVYTYVNYDEVITELESKNFKGGLLDMSAVMMFRGLTNVILSILYLPYSILEHSVFGLISGWDILVEEFGHVPNILRWIYNTWFVEILREWIGLAMSYLGWVLKPIWTGIVKTSIYGGLTAIMLSPVVLGYLAYFRYFRS